MAHVSDIRTQVFVVEVSASVMPPLTEDEIRAVVTRLAVEKEAQHGMGALAVEVYEGFNERTRRTA
jgi:hypothetical protein